MHNHVQESTQYSLGQEKRRKVDSHFSQVDPPRAVWTAIKVISRGGAPNVRRRSPESPLPAKRLGRARGSDLLAGLSQCCFLRRPIHADKGLDCPDLCSFGIWATTFCRSGCEGRCAIGVALVVGHWLDSGLVSCWLGFATLWRGSNGPKPKRATSLHCKVRM